MAVVPLTCNDLIGPDWLPGILLIPHGPDDEEVLFDPQLAISNPSGTQLIGQFLGDTRPFNIECDPINPNKLKIGFTRTHNDGTTTRYDGRVVRLPPNRGSVGIVRGRFRRPAVGPGPANVVVNGDWETEKPT